MKRGKGGSEWKGSRRAWKSKGSMPVEDSYGGSRVLRTVQSQSRLGLKPKSFQSLTPKVLYS